MSTETTRSFEAQRRSALGATETPTARDRTGSIRSRFGPRTEARVVEAARPQTQMQVAQDEVRRQSLSSRLMEHRQRTLSPSPVSPQRESSTRASIGVHTHMGTHRPSYLHARYYDRPDLILHSRRHIHMYYDPYHRLRHRVIWPTYYYPVYYPFGPRAYVHYVWPHYHRKYVFISLGGWWPYDYTYARYYWYGYHPYVWYGYYPVAREVVVGGDNYYTYNYYYSGDDGTSTTYSSSTPMDPSTQAELQARLEQKRAAEPAAPTLADTRFEEGVKSFEAGDYAAAAVKFDEAMRLAPRDVILPYAYAQALFADGHYDRAADVLRVALQNVSGEQESVFFPRGLYANDDVLFGQIQKLLDKIDRSGEDADLRLLLGYQLLGVGEIGHARDQLEQARQDPKNAPLVDIMLNVAEKMEKEAGPAVKAGTEADEASARVEGVPPSDRGQDARDTGAPAPQAGTATDTAESARPREPAEVSTPPVPVEAAPATGRENEPEGPEHQSQRIGPAQGIELPAQTDDDDPGGVEAAAPGDGDITAEKVGFFDNTAAGVWPGGSRWTRSNGPNYRADIASLASILSLTLAGVWFEWRILGRKAV